MADFLLVLILLQFKHLIADFFLQTNYIAQNKSIYGHLGGILHVAIHVVASAVVFLIVGTGLWFIIAIVIAEAIIHYHLDWAKEKFVAKRGLTTSDRMFWYALGVDQFLHHLTYLGMVQFWLNSQL